jgi:hypothetical protein
MNSSNQPEMNGSDLLKQPNQSYSSEREGCPWCRAKDDAPVEEHEDWCERKIMAKVLDKGLSNKLGAASKQQLEKLARTLQLELAEYTALLTRIATPVRPDGTFNLSREACQQLAAGILKKRHKL